MKRADKELILRLADFYCEAAKSPEGTPDSFINLVKAAVNIDALLETLDLAPLSDEKIAKIEEFGRRVYSNIQESDFDSAKEALTELINYVSENAPVEQLAPEFAAFMGAPMTPAGEEINQASRAMMQALVNPNPDSEDISAIRRGADVLIGLIEGGHIGGSFADLMEGFDIPETA